MKIIEKIEYTGVEQNASSVAILVKDDVINTKKLEPHKALLTEESDFKQIIPFLGDIELVVDISVVNTVANDTNSAAGNTKEFAENSQNKKINLSAAAIVPYNINRNRVYKDKATALNDIKGTAIANTDYSYGILVDA